MNKGVTEQKIRLDKRVEKFIIGYDGKHKHSVILKDGYRFSNTESCQDIGTLTELLDSIRNNIESYPVS